MGSSKKHKEKDREHKRKRKHRSRSRSREREGKRRHRDRDADPYPDYAPGIPDREEGEIEDAYGGTAVKQEPAVNNSSGGDISLSIEETNKLRAKLGLKPLEVNRKEPDLEKESLKDDIHKPAENWGQKRETEKIKERLERSKQRREISKKLDKVKTLGESDSDEDAATWVRKNRMKQREKERADKTARMLEEMDEEFGISNLVEEEFKDVKKTPAYTSRDLKGLKVEHDVNRFKEGQTIIMTLKDRGILDEDDEETLVNVNMVDLERAEKNVELRKKKPDYNPYDDAEEDEYGMFKPKEVLAKYDEEIQGEKKSKLTLGSGGAYNAEQDAQMERIRAELRAQSQTLSSNLTLASEYMTTEEMGGFKKFKKKKFRKIRKKKMLKADDLLPLQDDEASADGTQSKLQPPVAMETGDAIPGLDMVSDEDPTQESDDDVMPEEDLTNIPLEPDEADLELQAALNKARKLKQKKEKINPDVIAEKVLTQAERDREKEAEEAKIVMNATSEFCRALGDIPTYGQSGNREEIEKDELAELEKELQEERQRMEEEEDEPHGWNRVEIDETPVNITGDENAILEDEPVVATGIGGALAVALNKGFLENEEIKTVKLSNQIKELQAQNYSIEDKRYDDLDEKYKKRDRYSGMLMDFKEKSGYKPDVKLEYVDDSGRHLNQKEAFRQLSHRFHGKGSGKKKTEKRSKKVEEEQLMQKMSATDTPLNTVALLKEKQSQEKTPYIVLTGNKGFTHTMVKPTT